MAILTSKQTRDLNPEERQKQLQQLKTELSREHAAVSSGTKPENPGRIREIRRTIARILTIEHEIKKNPKPVATKKAAAKTPEVDKTK